MVRLLKFPCGELPPKLASNVRFGVRYDGNVYEGVDDIQDEIKIHMWSSTSNEDGLPISGLEINDELITDEELDTSTGTLLTMMPTRLILIRLHPTLLSALPCLAV